MIGPGLNATRPRSRRRRTVRSLSRQGCSPVGARDDLDRWSTKGLRSRQRNRPHDQRRSSATSSQVQRSLTTGAVSGWVGEVAEPERGADRRAVDGDVDLPGTQARVDVVAHEGIGNGVAQEVVRVAERDQLGLPNQAVRVARAIRPAVRGARRPACPRTPGRSAAGAADWPA